MGEALYFRISQEIRSDLRIRQMNMQSQQGLQKPLGATVKHTRDQVCILNKLHRHKLLRQQRSLAEPRWKYLKLKPKVKYVEDETELTFELCSYRQRASRTYLFFDRSVTKCKLAFDEKIDRRSRDN